MHEVYQQLLALSREIYTLRSIARLLGWDQQTLLPPRAHERRSAQRALVAGMIHERLVSDKLHALLEKLDEGAASAALGPEAAANVRELRRQHQRERNVPAALVDELERATSLAHQRWVEAKSNSDYEAFRPSLEAVVRLTKDWAQAVGYQDEPYDALLQTYEPGITSRNLDRLFTDLRACLVELLRKIEAAPRKPNVSLLSRSFDAQPLHEFGKQIAADIGFDFSAGRLDHAAHPFCSGIALDDVRITSYFNESNPLDSLFAIVHETGHGLYHQGLAAEHRGTPMGAAAFLGVHESQARWWENFVARSREFWRHYFPKLRAQCPGQLADIAEDEFVFAVNAVRPTLIRVEADEVTYNLHVLMRVELERALFRGELETADLPDAWNEKMDQYLGIRPAAAAEGILQDIHWSHGMFGYFPTYALGNLYAAQFDDKMREDIPDLDKLVSRGQFQAPREWLRSRIHSRGSLYPPLKLIEKATGHSLGVDHLAGYLQRKFGVLYGF